MGYECKRAKSARLYPRSNLRLSSILGLESGERRCAGVRGLGTNLVLSDDSSSDETVQLSQQLAAGNPKIRAIVGKPTAGRRSLATGSAEQ